MFRWSCLILFFFNKKQLLCILTCGTIFACRELAELPYVKGCIALSSKQPKGTGAATKGARKDGMCNHKMFHRYSWLRLIYYKKFYCLYCFQMVFIFSTAAKPVPKDKGVAGVLGKYLSINI